MTSGRHKTHFTIVIIVCESGNMIFCLFYVAIWVDKLENINLDSLFALMTSLSWRDVGYAMTSKILFHLSWLNCYADAL